jgi:hypothetical protein
MYGGATGTNAVTFAITSSNGERFTNYVLGAAETPYLGNDLSFTIKRGSIPFAMNDRFSFAIEANQKAVYRLLNGIWSSPFDIMPSVPIVNGLAIEFIKGASPSFVNGDEYRFDVSQPSAPRNALMSNGGIFRWSGLNTTMTCTLPSPVAITSVGVLVHSLIDTATVVCSLYLGASLVGTVAIPHNTGPMLNMFAPITVSKLVFSISNSPNGSIAWLYAGNPWESTYDATEYIMNRSYSIQRTNNENGVYKGSGKGGSIRWEHWFTSNDLTSLLAMLDHCKSNNDAPVVVIPNDEDKADAALVRFATDSLDFSDEYRFTDGTARMLTFELPLAAVMQ